MSRSAQEIQDWMIGRLSRLTGVPAQEIAPAEPVRRYGLDSVALVSFASELEEWLGYRFRENPFDEHPTTASLAAFLAAETAGPGRAG